MLGGWRAGVVFGGLAVLAACHGGPEVSPPATIRIDGEMADWDHAPGVSTLASDPRGDGRNAQSEASAIAPQADLVAVRAAHDADKLYFLLEVAGDIPPAGAVQYAVYIDADGRTDTGFAVGDNAIGADYVITSGTLLRHDSDDRTEWKWVTLPWKVEELESRPAEHKIEISVDRRAIQPAGAGPTTIGLLFATIDPHDPTMWEDDITDFAPERNERPGRIDYPLDALAPAGPPPAAVKPKVAGIRNYLLYYGGWDRTVIDKVTGYDLLIIDAHRGPRPSQIAPVVRRIRAGRNGIPGDGDDVIVLGYISLGEDVRTFDQAAPLPGDGRGPAHWDVTQGQLVYQNAGIASYYLDEKGPDGQAGRDGLPDRQGTWGACFVNPGDPQWQAFLLGDDGRDSVPYSAHLLIDVMGYQGLFMDTPEVADPWHGYGYTAEGLYHAIGGIRQSHPQSVLLLNRGVFFFIPHFPFQFRWSPRPFIDIGLYESHYLDSDYDTGNQPYHLSPFYGVNTAFFDQKVQAELQRTDDSFEVMLSLDYAADPDGLPASYPDVYRDAIASSVQSYGRVPLITTRLVDATPTLTLTHPMPPDTAPPRWGNTSPGFSSFLPTVPPVFDIAGNEDRSAHLARIGLQKAIPGDGQVTLRWDVALDQSLPVKYNVYYSETWPFDPARAHVLRDVKTVMGGDYVDRGFSGDDDACPYEHTVTGLDNGKTYYFVVRAQDSAPGGGHEDDNLVVLAAAPHKAGRREAITIDGQFDDWAAVPAFQDAAAETPGLAVDFAQARLAADEESFYLCYDTAQPADLTRVQVLINADGKSWTGLRTRGGADFIVKGRVLYRYSGKGTNDAWTMVAPVELAQQGTRVELKLPRAALAPSGEGPVFTFATVDGTDRLPDQGTGIYFSP
jgi:hypothetical protein